MAMYRKRGSAALVVAAALASACGGNNGPEEPPAGPPYNPIIPSVWATTISNPYFPLTPGATYQYRGQTAQGLETIAIAVQTQTRVIKGVTAIEVLDQVSLDGKLIEETRDWYAQDKDGNVWYLGEDSREILNGQVVSTEGTWLWGVNNALPGIIMWADPAAHTGTEYRQEYSKGNAEDWGKVIAVGQSVTVPAGSFTNCIRTEDWSGLDPAVREHKTYCPQVGFVLETPSTNPSERLELISKSP